MELNRNLKIASWASASIAIIILNVNFWGERIPSTAQGIKVDTWETAENGQPKVEHVAGWIWYNPLRYQVIEYPGEFQEVSGKFTFFTQEKLPVDVQVSTFVRPERMKAGEIYQAYRVQPEDLYNTLANRLLNDAVKKAGEGTPTEGLGNFTQLQNEIVEGMAKTFLKEHLEFTNTIVIDIDLPDEIESAVRAKVKASEQIANERQQTLLQEEANKRNLMQARGVSDVMEEQARANAFKIRQEASELTPLQIRKMWIEKWDGKLPSTITGDELSVLMDLK